MADAPMSDAECIQAAYEDALQATFKTFVSNLVTQGDATALSEFTSGLQLVRKAKTLALGAIGSSPSVAAAAEAPSLKRQRRAKR